MIKTAYPLPLRFAPGAKWEYSNTGYFALAEVIRTVTGRPWGEYLAEKVFKPVGMHFDPDDDDGEGAELCPGLR